MFTLFKNEEDLHAIAQLFLLRHAPAVLSSIRPEDIKKNIIQSIQVKHTPQDSINELIINLKNESVSHSRN